MFISILWFYCNRGFDLDQSVQLFETGPKRKLVDGEETVVFKKKKVN